MGGREGSDHGALPPISGDDAAAYRALFEGADR